MHNVSHHHPHTEGDNIEPYNPLVFERSLHLPSHGSFWQEIFHYQCESVRSGIDEEKIIVYGLHDVSMQQCVGGALSTAARTLQSCEQFERTSEWPVMLHRVEEHINDGCRNDHDSRHDSLAAQCHHICDKPATIAAPYKAK